MILFIISIVWVTTIGAILWRAIAQYRNYEVVGPQWPDLSEREATTTIIVPARNEERTIGQCIDALTRQDYPRQLLRIIIVDDNSVDDTAEVVRHHIAGNDRAELVQAGELPPGWLGKPHACWKAAAAARSEWLCFIDADTIGKPPLIRTAIRIATTRQLDMLSLQPFQILASVWEKLILPCGFFLIAFTQDLRKTRDPASAEASVNGQFLLIRRSAYLAAGGHAAVREAVAEDSALARLFKEKRFSLAVLGTRDLLETRMYRDLRSLCEGAARQAATLLPGIRLPLAAPMALILAWAPFILPICAIIALTTSGNSSTLIALILSLAGSLSLLGTQIGSAHYFRIPFWYGLLFPLGYTMGSAILLFATWQRAARKVRWKGRTYDAFPDHNSARSESLPMRPDALTERQHR
jgi:chlorobactene glucosyltransferase